jgi:hypothetical protein
LGKFLKYPRKFTNLQVCPRGNCGCSALLAFQGNIAIGVLGILLWRIHATAIGWDPALLFPIAFAIYNLLFIPATVVQFIKQGPTIGRVVHCDTDFALLCIGSMAWLLMGVVAATTRAARHGRKYGLLVGYFLIGRGGVFS